MRRHRLFGTLCIYRELVASVATFISIPFHHFVALKLIGVSPSANDTLCVWSPGTVELCLQRVFSIRRNNQEQDDTMVKNESKRKSRIFEVNFEFFFFFLLVSVVRVKIPREKVGIFSSCFRVSYSKRKFTLYECNKCKSEEISEIEKEKPVNFPGKF